MIYTEKEQKIAKQIDANATEDNWNDWKWQLKHRITTLDEAIKLLDLNLTEEMRVRMETTIGKFPLSTTPYYLSLIEAENFEKDPIFLQSVPSVQELTISSADMSDPLHEDEDSPVPGITHRYPDRVLFLVSNICGMYCRYCTRKRKVGDTDNNPSKEIINMGLEYIRKTPVIRDVLLSGGDPFMLSDEYLDYILTELRKIPHVEVIRIGTRMPVITPSRITDDLVNMLKKHHPIWINTQFNHPRELTATTKIGLEKMLNVGIPLGNQTVLLAGVNDCPKIMRSLVHKLVMNRVRPYYMYQCDLSEGMSHFRTSIGKGIEIIESLRGHTSGFCVPTYVVDAPGGGGKIPVMPNYLISWSANKVVLRNYEGVITTYKEPDNYKPPLASPADNDLNYRPIGVMKLLADDNETITLVPKENERIGKRD